MYRLVPNKKSGTALYHLVQACTCRGNLVLAGTGTYLYILRTNLLFTFRYTGCQMNFFLSVSKANRLVVDRPDHGPGIDVEQGAGPGIDVEQGASRQAKSWPRS